MKPAARLHLIKQREYFKTCPPGVERPGMAQAGIGINPSWINPGDGLGGGGFGDGSGGTSYYYGTGIGPSGENYGKVKYIPFYAFMCTVLEAIVNNTIT